MHRFIALFATVFAATTVSAIAAPASQLSCIYDTVPPEKLVEFGKAATGEEPEEGLGIALNVARNACIDIYSWSEEEARIAETYFGNRVARERLEKLVERARVDPRKLLRAYEKAMKAPAFGEAFTLALQRDGYPTYDDEMMKAANGFAALRSGEAKAVEAFAGTTKSARD
jgi:hypothetical protein